MTDSELEIYDIFLSHSHKDAKWVEQLAIRLEDECSFKVWLDKWRLVAGKNWQQAIVKGLDQANCCAVCFNGNTPKGWFQQEIERSLDIQTKRPEFGVIPVLLPDTSDCFDLGFLGLRTWADFRKGEDAEYAFHVLKQGINNEPIGRWPPGSPLLVSSEDLTIHEQRLVKLQKFRALGVHEEVVIKFEEKILNMWFEEEAGTR